MQESVTYLPVTVYIDDINDHKPVFAAGAPYNITVLESATPGTTHCNSLPEKSLSGADAANFKLQA